MIVEDINEFRVVKRREVFVVQRKFKSEIETRSFLLKKVVVSHVWQNVTDRGTCIPFMNPPLKAFSSKKKAKNWIKKYIQSQFIIHK